ncbi:MAG: PmeII family type II restriction endonuclease, partial [Candidatus Kapaibacterium sp.]
MEAISHSYVLNEYIRDFTSEFHESRNEHIKSLSLERILEYLDPYRIQFIDRSQTVGSIIKAITDAFISSNEETIFGDWLEGLAIFINKNVFGGRKSGINGIDLEFDNDNIRYIVSIKSGPNWGNSSQIKKMRDDFKKAQQTLRTSNSGLFIVAVNGCCYGKDNRPDKGDYFKYCGQRFWEFISGDPDLFKDIIEPIGHKAKERNEIAGSTKK